jgi:hypothetical protein
MVNYRRLPQFLDVLFRPDAHGQFDQLAGLVSEGLLGVKLTGSAAQLQGFSNPETARGSLQRKLRGQLAQPLGLTPYLSTRTALLLHLAANPGRTWPARSAALQDSTPRAAALDSLRATFGAEMAIAYLAATAASSRPGRLAFVQCPRPARTVQWLARLRRLNNNSPALPGWALTRCTPWAFRRQQCWGPCWRLRSRMP